MTRAAVEGGKEEIIEEEQGQREESKHHANSTFPRIERKYNLIQLRLRRVSEKFLAQRECTTRSPPRQELRS
jgi:hypothetical protein